MKATNSSKKFLVGAVAAILSVSTVISASAATLPTSTDANLVNFATQQVDSLFAGMDLSPSQREQRISDTVEKYSAPAAAGISTFSSAVPCSVNEPDVYEIYLEKESYIIGLINRLGGAASNDSLEYNKDFLEEHYQEILEVGDVNISLVDWYIEETKYALIGQNFASSILRPAARAAYSRTNAVNYANSYWSSYNSSYPDWSSYGGDCANFISQCLKAGGKTYTTSQSAATSTTAQDWSKWYSYGSSNDTTLVSSTHRGANAFKNYWQSNASYSTFYSVGSSSYAYGYTGDAISLLNSNGSAYHTLIIVGYDSANNDFIVAAHTNDTHTKKLSAYSGLSNGFIIYSM